MCFDDSDERTGDVSKLTPRGIMKTKGANTMQAYEGYFTDNGRFIPLGEAIIPEGSRAIVTLLDESTEQVSRRQKAAITRFRNRVKNSKPLPPEFDDIMNQRVKITRELDL